MRLGTTRTPSARAWPGRISEALSVTMRTVPGDRRTEEEEAMGAHAQDPFMDGHLTLARPTLLASARDACAVSRIMADRPIESGRNYTPQQAVGLAYGSAHYLRTRPINTLPPPRLYLPLSNSLDASIRRGTVICLLPACRAGGRCLGGCGELFLAERRAKETPAAFGSFGEQHPCAGGLIVVAGDLRDDLSDPLDYI